MDANQFRSAAHAAIEEIISYYATLATRPVLSPVSPGYLSAQLPPDAPVKGEAWPAIQADIEAKIMPGITHWQSPDFMAYFPAGTTFPSMLGELYSASLTGAAFNWQCSPAVTELETVVLDWLARMSGLPEAFLSRGAGGGVVHGSASEAVVTVMVCARDRYLREATRGLGAEAAEMEVGRLRGRLVALGSEGAHSSSVKAAKIAGTRWRSVPVCEEDDWAMRGRALEQVLRECEEQGLVPFYITATLGTTATCAVDNFAEIAAVLRAHPLIWVHVDAAYAGAALICPEYQHLSAPLAAFDSYNVNMHKWLLVNFDASCLFVRRRADLTATLSVTPSYLRNGFSATGLVTDYRDWQIPLGRRFRALKIWFVMRSYGVSGMQEVLRRHVRWGETFAGWVGGRPDLFALVARPAFALTVLRVRPGGEGEGEEVTRGNEVTQRVYDQVMREGKIFLTSSEVGRWCTIRVVSANPLAREENLRAAFEMLVRIAEEVLGVRGKGGDEKGVNGVNGVNGCLGTP